MSVTLFDDRACQLGEGPLWHPERGQLFWFDIFGRRMLSRTEAGPQEWAFDDHVSAAGWIDRDRLMIAQEQALSVFDLETGAQTEICPLEADDPVTRSNDGRADPQGGFWIGTMGKALEPNRGAIYRWYRGDLRRLYAGITIPNAICFAPDGQTAYWTDTPTQIIHRQPLDPEGWPVGAPEPFVDLSGSDLSPDGAVIDGEGCLWSAQWGAGRVARYAPDGRFLSAIECPPRQTSCPAFGGSRLFVTSAADGAGPGDHKAGQTFVAETGIKGQREHQVICTP